MLRKPPCNLSLRFSLLVALVSMAALALLSAGSLGAAEVTHSPPRAVKERLSKKAPPIVLDVRTPAEYAQGHLANAVLIPADQVDAKVESILKDRGAEVVVYCAVGGRSKAASRILKDKGYSNVTNMVGGIVAWEKAGLPVVKN
jgi:rhodanese-related sulfurtransferase